jgi:hypothetical protein
VGRKKQDVAERKTRVLGVRVTEELAQRVVDHCWENRTTVPELLRRLIVARLQGD